MVYEIETGIERQITNDTTYAKQSLGIDDQGNIVWAGMTGGSTNTFEIFFSNGETIYQLTSNDWDERDSKVDSGQVVWVRFVPSEQQLLFWDGTFSEDVPTPPHIIAGRMGIRDPVIRTGYIAYLLLDRSVDPSAGWDVYLYKIATGETIRLTTTGEMNHAYNDQIDQEGGQVVWVAENLVHFFDGTQERLLTHPECIYAYQPKISKGKIVWWGYDGTTYQVFFYDGTAVVKLTNDDQTFKNRDVRIENGLIFWIRGEKHPFDSYALLNPQIYYLKDAQMTAATNDAFSNKYGIEIENGQVVYQAIDPVTYKAQIFLLRFAPAINTINIDIRPFLRPNAWGMFRVTILSSSEFDAPGEVDKSSLTFGRTGNEESYALCRNRSIDANHDGLRDLICYFWYSLAGFQPGDTEGILKGRTILGKPFAGRDTFSLSQ